MYYSHLAVQQDKSKNMLTGNRVKKLTLAINTALLVSSLAITSTALAQPNENTKKTANQLKQAVVQVNISAGSLSQVLSQFSGTIGVALSFDANLLAGKKSAGITGKYSAKQKSAEQGFNKLLAGSGYHISYLGNNNYKLVADSALGTLATAQVTGFQETATSRFEGYAATRSSTGTKTDTLLIETPQSITVVGAEEINIRKAQSLSEVLAYSAGITPSGGPDKTSDSLMIRGFESYAGVGTMYRDGKRYLTNVYDGTLEPFGVERVEILKGAASLLYGASAPGGIINSISKRPTTESINEIGFDFGSFDRKQLTVDFAGALTNKGDLSYRLTMLKRDSDSFIDFIPDNKTYIAPALSWKINDATKFTFLSYYQKNESAYNSNLPIQGSLLANENGKIPRQRFTGESGKDSVITENINVNYILEHQFTEQLSINHSVNYFRSKGKFNWTWLSGFESGQSRIIKRAFEERDEKSNGFTIDTYMNYHLTAHDISHNITAGIDISHFTFNTIRYDRSLGEGTLDLFTPTYGGDLGAYEPYYSGSSKSETSRIGVYLQDQIKVADKWVVALGLRQEFIDYQESPTIVEENWEKEDADALTGNVGLVYLADNGFAPFISYSQSFEMQNGKNAQLERFDPTQGEQIETGLRYQPKSEDWLLSTSVYQLSQTNVLTTDPDNSRLEVQTGEVMSKGFEIEFTGRLSDNVQITSAYAYTDARTTKSKDPTLIDKRTNNVPYNQFSLWTDYQFNQLNLPELTLGGGIRYIGEAYGAWSEGIVKVPAYTLFDFMLSYETTQWRYALNISNLSDKNYISACSWGCSYGEGRKIIASVNYNF